MYKTAIRAFVVSSIAFGVFGVIFFVAVATGGDDTTMPFALWGISGVAVLVSTALTAASLALAFAAKYLDSD